MSEQNKQALLVFVVASWFQHLVAQVRKLSEQVRLEIHASDLELYTVGTDHLSGLVGQGSYLVQQMEA